MKKIDGIIALELDDVLRAAVAATGARVAVRDAGLIDSALHRPFGGFGSFERYPTLSVKVGALLHSLARNHTLVDGNKRTAWVSAKLFARANQWKITAPSQQAIVDLVLDAAEDQKTVEEIAAVLNTW